jgi:hypothetical protein
MACGGGGGVDDVGVGDCGGGVGLTTTVVEVGGGSMFFLLFLLLFAVRGRTAMFVFLPSANARANHSRAVYPLSLCHLFSCVGNKCTSFAMRLNKRRMSCKMLS